MAINTRFAWIFDEKSPRSGAEWDREILRTEHFVVVPSAGSLVAGWVLAVPRRPMFNLSQTDLAERQELGEIVKIVSRLLETKGEEVFCFEHGSCKAGSLTGCGVDQAHLHIVPLPFDLLSAVSEKASDDIVWHQQADITSPLDALPESGEYVAVWSVADGRNMIGNVRRPISQWVRRVIADKLGIGAEWNYRNHPKIDQIRQTLEIMSGLRMTQTG